MMLSKILLIDLNPFYGLIAVSGPDAQSFLQGQLTADIREITPTKPGFSAYCNPKGRIRALFRIFYHHDSYFLQLPMGVLPSALEALKKVARFSKVTLEDVSQQWQRIGLCVPQNYLADLVYLKTTELKEIYILPLHSHEPYKRLELIGLPHIIKPIGNKLAELETSEIADFDTWKNFDIKAGIPEIWPETVEQFLPHTLNLPALGAVSFTKGCYCGQEIVARMEYRADVKHKLFTIKTPTGINEPLPGSKIFDENGSDEVIGTVVTASKFKILGVRARLTGAVIQDVITSNPEDIVHCDWLHEWSELKNNK